MYKLLLTIVSFVFVAQCFGQYYPNVKKDFITIDKNNEIYVPGKEFSFDVSITKNGAPVYLESNDSLNFSLSEIKPVNGIDEFTMVVLKARPFKRHTLFQTDIAYIFGSNIDETIERSTLVENKKNVYFQLPTYGFFQLLQQASAPYIKAPYVIGQDWHDRNMIEDYFGNEEWGMWDYTLSTSHDYQIKNIVQVDTKEFGELECYKIDAITKSRVGTHYMTAFFNEQYGFVSIKYDFESGHKIEITLNDIKETTAKKPFKNIEVLKEYKLEKKKKINDSIVLE